MSHDDVAAGPPGPLAKAAIAAAAGRYGESGASVFVDALRRDDAVHREASGRHALLDFSDVQLSWPADFTAMGTLMDAYPHAALRLHATSYTAFHTHVGETPRRLLVAVEAGDVDDAVIVYRQRLDAKTLTATAALDAMFAALHAATAVTRRVDMRDTKFLNVQPARIMVIRSRLETLLSIHPRVCLQIDPVGITELQRQEWSLETLPCLSAWWQGADGAAALQRAEMAAAAADLTALSAAGAAAGAAVVAAVAVMSSTQTSVATTDVNAATLNTRRAAAAVVTAAAAVAAATTRMTEVADTVGRAATAAAAAAAAPRLRVEAAAAAAPRAVVAPAVAALLNVGGVPLFSMRGSGQWALQLGDAGVPDFTLMPQVCML